MLQTSSDHHSSVNAPLAVDLSSSHHIASFLSLEKGKPWMVCSLEKNNHSYGEQFQINESCWNGLFGSVTVQHLANIVELHRHLHCMRIPSCYELRYWRMPPAIRWPLTHSLLVWWTSRQKTSLYKTRILCISTISDCDLCNLSLNHLHDANEPIVGASVKRGCWALGFLVERCFRSNFTVFTFDFFSNISTYLSHLFFQHDPCWSDLDVVICLQAV